MSKRLAAKAGLIQFPGQGLVEPVAPRQEPSEAKAKTAPGAMMQFLSSQSEAIKEVDLLREQIKQFEGASPVLLIDPRQIRPSKWANRHASSFDGPDFELFKAEISSAGGNVQPIRVRPCKSSGVGALLTGSPQYELIYGHRRHRACLELGIPVSALVDKATDQELFEAMERENRNRKNLSAWEQGCMYLRAIDEGLYASQRKLAEAINVDVSLVSKSLTLARLPAAVIEAFPSPLEIQFRWAQPLSEALQKDPEALLARAQEIRTRDLRLSAAQVLAALTAPPAERASVAVAAAKCPIAKDGKRIGQLTLDNLGVATLRLDAGLVSSADLEGLAKHVEAFFSR